MSASSVERLRVLQRLPRLGKSGDGCLTARHEKYGQSRGAERRNRYYSQGFTGNEPYPGVRPGCTKTSQTREKRVGLRPRSLGA